jgi:predicted secreted Zn-dependent protease
LVKTDYILAHEQGHFDITEIYSRRLHQALLEYNFNRKTYQLDINRIYEKIVREKETLQDLYDKQSDHSRNKKTQTAWLEIIEALLVETEPYADYP